MAEPQHGIRITSKSGDVHEIPTIAQVQAGLRLRQERLTPGDNIVISPENRISSTYAYDDTEIKDGLATETQERNDAVSELEQKISTLNGAIIYIGKISKTKKQIEANMTLLDAWCESNDYPQPYKPGYCIVDSNANDWVWNGEEWIDIGYYEVAKATNSSLGLVKGVVSTKGKISVDSNGEMSVNGWEELNPLNGNNNVQNSGSMNHLFTELDDCEMRYGEDTRFVTGWKTVYFDGEFTAKPSVAVQIQGDYNAFAVVRNITSKSFEYDVRIISTSFTASGTAASSGTQNVSGTLSIVSSAGMTSNYVAILDLGGTRNYV
jgi:hypothetical protein